MTLRVLWAPTSLGVAAAVYDDQGRVLLVRQRYTAGWRLPGGGVGRGEAASTCLLLYQPPLNETGARRLTTIRDTEDGFRIAEEDLAMRGAGDLIGTAQSGLPKFRVADLERQASLMALAQSDARKLMHDDPELTGPRGQAARALLWLMDQDRALRLMSVG